MSGNKDRKAHEASRGRKKLKLTQLASQRPTEEQLLRYAELLERETDRGLAVMAAALVENALELAIRSRIADPGEHISSAWFSGINAPFGTFGSKIQLGRALAIYGEHMQGRLATIKDVRNAFAHSSIPLDFTHSAVRDACEGLAPKEPEEIGKSQRAVFGAMCLTESICLIRNAFEHGGKELEISFP
jgi:hypothetical protein